jgi:hypothetical protein
LRYKGEFSHENVEQEFERSMGAEKESRKMGQSRRMTTNVRSIGLCE